MEEIVTLIANLGFPIAISVYLLTFVSKKLETLTEAINDLDKTLKSFCSSNLK